MCQIHCLRWSLREIDILKGVRMCQMHSLRGSFGGIDILTGARICVKYIVYEGV